MQKPPRPVGLAPRCLIPKQNEQIPRRAIRQSQQPVLPPLPGQNQPAGQRFLPGQPRQVPDGMGGSRLGCLQARLQPPSGIPRKAREPGKPSPRRGFRILHPHRQPVAPPQNPPPQSSALNHLRHRPAIVVVRQNPGRWILPLRSASNPDFRLDERLKQQLRSLPAQDSHPGWSRSRGEDQIRLGRRAQGGGLLVNPMEADHGGPSIRSRHLIQSPRPPSLPIRRAIRCPGTWTGTATGKPPQATQAQAQRLAPGNPRAGRRRGQLIRMGMMT